MMKNSVDVNNEDSVQSYDQVSKYEQSGNIGDQQQLSFTTEAAHSKLNYNQSPTIVICFNAVKTITCYCSLNNGFFHFRLEKRCLG